MKNSKMKLLVAMITALALFASVPSPASGQTNQAGAVAKTISITRNSAPPPQMVAVENFTGFVGIEPLFQADEPSRLAGFRVTFAPGARTAWHTHPAGQTLIVTAGVGLVQQWGSPTQEIRPGDVVRIPPGQKRWHGASANNAMTHIALLEQLNGKTVDWMEKVSDAQYNPPAAPAVANAQAQTSVRPSQRAIGDFAPKLADITDDVLYGDIWERPQLSRRDRSLVTVAALIAMNRPDQLRSHIARARANGVTKEEVVETITQMAFYAGWPNAVSALAVAKEVFQQQ